MAVSGIGDEVPRAGGIFPFGFLREPVDESVAPLIQSLNEVVGDVHPGNVLHRLSVALEVAGVIPRDSLPLLLGDLGRPDLKRVHGHAADRRLVVFALAVAAGATHTELPGRQRYETKRDPSIVEDTGASGFALAGAPGGATAAFGVTGGAVTASLFRYAV